MQYTIPIRASQTSKGELATLLSSMETEDFDVSVLKGETSGLAMDPATVTLLLDAAKVIVPSLLTIIGTVWVAHIQNRKKDDKSDEKSNTQAPVIVIETYTGNIRIVLDTPNVKDSVMRVPLPTTIEEITRIRLEGEYYA